MKTLIAILICLLVMMGILGILWCVASCALTQMEEKYDGN